MIFSIGFGANGKSVFGNVVGAIIGDYARTAPSSLLVARRNDDTTPRTDIAALAGARYVSINELQGGDRLDEQVVKQLAGREPISARFLYKEFFEFTPQFTCWVRSNHKPIITGTDDGIWRRLILVPFNRKFHPDEQDQNLEKQLLDERDAILAWMIQGAIKWQQDGLKLSPTMIKESQSYRTESDLLGQFLDECCTINPNEKVIQNELYSSWKFWCMENGVSCGIKPTFGKRLAERGITTHRSNSKDYYVGAVQKVQKTE